MLCDGTRKMLHVKFAIPACWHGRTSLLPDMRFANRNVWLDHVDWGQSINAYSFTNMSHAPGLRKANRAHNIGGKWLAFTVVPGRQLGA